jgi:hypothetical protein
MSDTLNARARAFLRSVQHADDPTRADYERVHAGLEAKIAAGVAASAVALSAGKTATAGVVGSAAPAKLAATGAVTALAGKIGAAVVIVGVVAGGTAAVVRHANRVDGATRLPGPTATAAAVTRDEVRATTSATSASSLPPPGAAPAEAPRPTPKPPAVKASVAIAAPVPPIPGATAAVLSTADTPSPLDGEVTLLRGARAALRGGDARRALAMLDEHESRFPGGALAEECDAERIYALCALGRAEEARALAARFVAERPASPHAAAVRASCGFAAGK